MRVFCPPPPSKNARPFLAVAFILHSAHHLHQPDSSFRNRYIDKILFTSRSIVVIESLINYKIGPTMSEERNYHFGSLIK